jgi:DNA-directed RNA polymerase beta' subunit
MLQEACDALTTTAAAAGDAGTGNHRLKSLSDMLSGAGRFRQNLLGKRVTTRPLVIVVGPEPSPPVRPAQEDGARAVRRS